MHLLPSWAIIRPAQLPSTYRARRALSGRRDCVAPIGAVTRTRARPTEPPRLDVWRAWRHLQQPRLQRPPFNWDHATAPRIERLLRSPPSAALCRRQSGLGAHAPSTSDAAWCSAPAPAALCARCGRWCSRGGDNLAHLPVSRLRVFWPPQVSWIAVSTVDCYVMHACWMLHGGPVPRSEAHRQGAAAGRRPSCTLLRGQIHRQCSRAQRSSFSSRHVQLCHDGPAHGTLPC